MVRFIKSHPKMALKKSYAAPRFLRHDAISKELAALGGLLNNGWKLHERGTMDWSLIEERAQFVR